MTMLNVTFDFFVASGGPQMVISRRGILITFQKCDVVFLANEVIFNG